MVNVFFQFTRNIFVEVRISLDQPITTITIKFPIAPMVNMRKREMIHMTLKPYGSSLSSLINSFPLVVTIDPPSTPYMASTTSDPYDVVLLNSNEIRVKLSISST